MESAPDQHHKGHHDQTPPVFNAAPPVAPPPVHPTPMHHAPVSTGGFLSRTSGAFAAEYSFFLIALGIALTNLTSLLYVFFSLIVLNMHGAGVNGSAIQFFASWLIVSSVVVIPTAIILWHRTQGELAANKDFNGEPRGAARGFRTFWIVLSALGMVIMLITGLYAPVAALIGGSALAETLIGATIPSILGLAVTGSGIYIATRPVNQVNTGKMLLWVVAAATVVLFSATFIWAMNMRGSSYSTPSRYNNDRYYDSYDY